MKNFIRIIILIIVFCLSGCAKKCNEWVDSFGKRQYYNESGKKLTNCYAEINGDLYFFDSKGNLLTNTIVKYDNERGIVFPNGKFNKGTGLRLFKNNWYYLKNGIIQTGIAKEGGTLYFFDADGKMASNGWNYDNNKNTYVYVVDGKAKTGWLKEGDKWYYLLLSGYMVKGWQEIDGEWYFFDEKNGDLKLSTIIDNTYAVDENGKMIHSGWYNINGQMLYFESDGKINRNRNYEQEVRAQQNTKNRQKSSGIPQFKYIYNADGINAVVEECAKYRESVRDGNKIDVFLLKASVEKLEALGTQAKGYGIQEALIHGISYELEKEYTLLNTIIVGMKMFVQNNLY